MMPLHASSNSNGQSFIASRCCRLGVWILIYTTLDFYQGTLILLLLIGSNLCEIFLTSKVLNEMKNHTASAKSMLSRASLASRKRYIYNLFVTSKIEFSNPPILEFKVLHKSQRALQNPFLMVYKFLFITLKNSVSLIFLF